MRAHDVYAYVAGGLFAVALMWLVMWLQSAYFQDKVREIPWGVTDPARIRQLEREAPARARRTTAWFRRTQWVTIVFTIAGIAFVIAAALN